MFYLIYKTTNLLNGKFYIGMHKTKNKDDGYTGSGKLLKRAMAKYGRDCFETTIVIECISEQHMKVAEKILVVPDGETNYNLCPGGKGGFGFINLNSLNWTPEKNAQISGFKNLTEEQRASYSAMGVNSLARKQYVESVRGISKSTDHLNTTEAADKRKKSFAKIGHQSGSKNSQYGRPRSEETRRKISESLKKKRTP